jgi:nucleolar pre-ribosomal-associated protein 2
MLQTSADKSAPTRPRLQSVNQDFSDLNEQIRQVAHIIRLPDNWAIVEDAAERSSALQHVVRARAEWVLRWLLDKLKDETEAGSEARANASTWQLLECMIHILPVSRSAPHLRDAAFTSILERALVENFDKDLDSPDAPTDGHAHSRNHSESSETVCDDTQPSRKRKRGSPAASPSKKTALASPDPVLLFRAISAVLRSITGTATVEFSYDSTQTELMKMVLRTESAQAARILKFWMTTVQKLTARTPTQGAEMDLSMVLEIWELRIIDANDNTGSSSEDFANECLVPTLQLVEDLKRMRPVTTGQHYTRTVDLSLQALDRLLSRHVLAPTRSAFFNEVPADGKEDSTQQGASALTNSLGPLRAILLQAAQIEDAGEVVPSSLASSSKAIGHLLDLAIRASPSRTPKARLAERPWIQAVFLSLAECVGCSLTTAPEHATSNSAVAALRSALDVLRFHNVTIDSAVLRDLFWYHCGVKYPEHGEKQVHWVLIAALIELDASIFATEPRSVSNSAKGPQADLTEFLFDKISDTEFKGAGSTTTQSLIDHLETDQEESREFILKSIVTPLMSAFSRNRNMLGFMRRWDHQLLKAYRFENRKALKEKKELIWEDRVLTQALAELFEQSLTQGQIATLLEEHATRMNALSDALMGQAKEDVNVRKLAAYKEAASSAVIVPAILQATQSDNTLAALRPQLHSLLELYAKWVCDDQYSTYTRLSLSWRTLCQLLAKLWPIEMHASLQLQQQTLHPLLKKAINDMTQSRQDTGGRKVDSSVRAAAIIFSFVACDRLRTVPGSEELVQNTSREVMKSLLASELEAKELAETMKQFCANFVQLLGDLDAQAAQQSILTMLSRLSTFDDNSRDHISGSLSQAVFMEGDPALENAYCAALSDALDTKDNIDLCQVVLYSLLHIQPTALARERREAILDRLSTLWTAGSSEALDIFSAIVQLMETPNASAKISTDGGVVFDIALRIQKQGLNSRTILQQLQLLCQRTLAHIVPNQSQAQSRVFLGEYQKRLNSFTQGAKKVSPTGLAMLRATIKEQKDSQLLGVKQYTTLLKQCLTDDGTDGADTASFEDVLDAFDELSPALLGDPTSLKATTSWLRTWIKENADLDSYIISSQSGSVEVAQYVARLYKLVARYRLYPDSKWLVALTKKLLSGPLPDEQQKLVLASIAEVLTPLETSEKLSLVPLLSNNDDPYAQSASYSILKVLLSTLPDKLSTDPVIKQTQRSLLPKICGLLVEKSNMVCFNVLMDTIDTILNHKASLTTQHSAECVLAVLFKLTSRSSPDLPAEHASHIFIRLCETSRLLLLVHRNKLGGRSHILLPLLQDLLFCLFMPTSARSGALPLWLRSNTPNEPICLTPADAAQYTRLLSTLCNPPQSSISKAHQHSRKSKDLNDPVKAARERTSHFLYPLLASLCRFQLTGRLLPAVRAKLMPGLWEVVGTASLHKDELDAMFAGLSRSEKDVWRNVWGEWESVHGRKERFLGVEDV